MTPRRAVATLLALTVMAAACGSGDDATTEVGDTTSSVAPAQLDGAGAPTGGGTGDPSTLDTASTGAASGASGSAAPKVGDGSTNLDVYVPPAGRYTYDTSGFSESGSGATRRRSEPPPESTDEVSVDRQGGTTTVTTRTSYGSSGQETVVTVTGAAAHLTRLTYWFTNAGVVTQQAVSPQPALLVARLPHVVGDRWESAWRDPSIGIHGVGWGGVIRRETVTTGRGPVAAVVLQLHQRLEGTISGELDVTTWIDPTTGIVARQVLITDLVDATGASHSEITRVLAR